MSNQQQTVVATAVAGVVAFVGVATLTVVAVKMRAKNKHKNEMYNLDDKADEEGTTELGHTMRKIKRLNFNKVMGNLFGSNNAAASKVNQNNAKDASSGSESSVEMKDIPNSDVENVHEEKKNPADISPSLQEIDEVCFNMEEEKVEER